MLKLLGVALATLSVGCTFYTSCPNGTTNNNPPPAGGTPGAGGSGGMPTTNVGGQAEAPTGPWVDATGTLEGTHTGFANVTYVAARPDRDELLGGLSAAGLWSSVDGGTKWTQVGLGKGSAEITHRTIAIVFDPDDKNSYWVAGQYGPALYKTSDSGKTFEQLGDVNSIESISIDLTDPKRKTIIGVEHEMMGRVWLSTDAGATFEDIKPQLPANTGVCSYAQLLDGDTVLITCSMFNSKEHGIYRSTDTGQSWTQVSTTSANQAALLASDGALYWSVESNGGMLKSVDQGQSWTGVLNSSLSVHPIELSDGSIVTATKEYLVLSSDGGKSWRPVTSQLPFAPVGFDYSAFQHAFYIWAYTNSDTVPAMAIQRYDFDPAAEQ